MKQHNVSIYDYLEMALRRKWFVIVPFVLITLGGVVVSSMLPRIYRASTAILVQKQSVPEDYIKPTVTSNIGERLQTLSQQIMSRTRLETIIDEFNLYPDLRGNLFMEEIVEKMRADIALKVKGNDAFELFYLGKSPKVVAAVANRLASLFIEENLKMREDLAEGTTEFLDRQLSRVKMLLEEQEEAIRAFKERNMGALPEQLDANLRSLSQLHLQLHTIATSLENARGRKDSLQNQISTLQGFQSQVGTTSAEGEGIKIEQPNSSLEELEAMLSALLTKYKEKHPDVIRLRNQIKGLKEELQALQEATLADEGAEGVYTPPPPAARSFTETLASEVDGIEKEIMRLQEEQDRLKARIALYQKRIEDTPKREQELSGLQRDYDNTRKNYESLLDKKLNAQIASNLEKVQKGERFKVLDPAQVPQKPFKPNQLKIILMAVMLGLGCGAALAFGLEYLDTSFRDMDELEKIVGLPVLASIPRIVTDADLKQRKLKRNIALVSSLGLLALVLALALIHLYVVPLDFWAKG